MRELADLAVQMDDPAYPTCLAIIADNSHHFGLARMYDAYRSLHLKSARQVAIFRTPEEALRWLSSGRTGS